MSQEFSRADVEKLVALASKRLNTTPEQLKEAFERSGFSALGETGNADDIQSFRQMAEDPQKATAFLNSPTVKALMENLLKGG